jgi:hypothetical protein
MANFSFSPGPAAVPDDNAVHIGQADANALEFVGAV